LFHKFLFAFLSFVCDTDVIMTFVALLVPFSYEEKRLAQYWTIHNWRIRWPAAFTTQNMLKVDI